MPLSYIKNYLHVDYEEDDELINNFINQAEIYIDNMAGTGYKTHADAVELKNILLLKLVSDMYENRGTHILGANNLKRDIMVVSILDKLSLYEG